VLLACALCVMGALLGTLSLRAGSAAANSDPGGNWSLFHSPDMTPQYLGGVTCVSASDCWAAGSYTNEDNFRQTLIEHWDGSSWAIVFSPNTSPTESNSLSEVTCTATSDCWAVGRRTVVVNSTSTDYTLVEHWDGTTWSIATSPNAAGSSKLLNVACAAAADCWAVGYYSSGTLIEHWDGSSWSIVASPNAAGSNRLYSVTCTSTADCWAVGYYLSGSSRQTLVEHWNGVSWTIVTSPNTRTTEQNFLYGVTCASTANCWSVGFSYGTGNDQTLVEHWDGNTWSIVSSPNAAGNSQLYSITCASASDCWAVGDDYDPNYVLINRSLIEHWNGSSWSVVAAASTSAAGNHDELSDVTCVSASQCWAVGDIDVDTGLIERWNGTTWSIVASPTVDGGGLNNVLYGTTCTSVSDCWAVGIYTTPTYGVPYARPNQTLIEHWDGSAWSVVPSPNIDAADNYLQRVACTSASDCWAVGGYYTGYNQTLIEHWDGNAWSVVNSPSATGDNYLTDVTCTSASDCWAAGYYYNTNHIAQTLIEHWNGVLWSISTSPNTSATDGNFLQHVSCASASDCWAVGNSGGGSNSRTLVEHWNGSGWTIMPSPNGNPADYNSLTGVSCASTSDCWAVGDYYSASVTHTLVVHWDGTLWTIVTSPDTTSPANYLNSVTCASATNCWAVGKYFAYSDNIYGAIYHTFTEHWDGSTWSIVFTPGVAPSFTSEFRSVTCPSASRCWAVGFYRNYGTQINQTLIEEFTPLAPLTSVVSSKTHGDAGIFEVNLPLDGTGIECRTGGPSGDHTLIFNFANTLISVGGAGVTAGTGSVGSSTIGADGHQYIVNLTGVTNAQRLDVTLNNVHDAAGNISSAISSTMGVLVGDTNANRTVSNADVASIQAQVGATVTQSNFRNDVNANGTLSNGDVAATQAQVGTQLLP
jgi:hypothetical protein